MQEWHGRLMGSSSDAEEGPDAGFFTSTCEFIFASPNRMSSDTQHTHPIPPPRGHMDRCIISRENVI